MINNPYWPVAFDLYFSESILIAMFGKAAIQHAQANSYPHYFKNALERGLKRSDYQENYFLQHIFLGYYINNRDSCPAYLRNRNIKNDFHYINDSLLKIPIQHYDLISLSNIFDWMDEENICYHLNYLNSYAKKP